MLRILLWMILKRYYSMRSRYNRDTNLIYYFAYGANVNRKTLISLNIKPKFEMAYELKDHKICFAHPSSNEGIGYASIQASPGSSVWGKLYILTAIEMKMLDCIELASIFHRYKRVQIVENGKIINFYVSLIPKLGLTPSQSYLSRILLGIENCHSIPSAYCDQLKNINTISMEKESYAGCYFIRNINKLPRLIKPLAIFYELINIKILKYLEK